MGRELSEEELLFWLKEANFWYTKRISTDKDKQAYNQICKLIEGKPRVSKKFVEDLTEKKARRFIGMSLYSCKGVSLHSQITKEEAVCFINQLIKEVIQETGVEIED